MISMDNHLLRLLIATLGQRMHKVQFYGYTCIRLNNKTVALAYLSSVSKNCARGGSMASSGIKRGSPAIRFWHWETWNWIGRRTREPLVGLSSEPPAIATQGALTTWFRPTFTACHVFVVGLDPCSLPLGPMQKARQ